MLKTLFYIIVILWILRKIGGFLFRSWVTKAVEEQQKYAHRRSDNQSRTQDRRKEGEVFISSDNSNKDVKSDKVGGDYVDYEEIK